MNHQKTTSSKNSQRDGKKLTQAKVAELWGMSQQGIGQMVKKGMPMDSLEAATAWRTQSLEKRTPKAYTEARTRKVLLECEKLEMQLATLRADYEPKAQVREDGIRVLFIFTEKMAALVKDASGALAGLDEAAFRKELHWRTQKMLSEIKDEIKRNAGLKRHPQTLGKVNDSMAVCY